MRTRSFAALGPTGSILIAQAWSLKISTLDLYRLHLKSAHRAKHGLGCRDTDMDTRLIKGQTPGIAIHDHPHNEGNRFFCTLSAVNLAEARNAVGKCQAVAFIDKFCYNYHHEVLEVEAFTRVLTLTIDNYLRDILGVRLSLTDFA